MNDKKITYCDRNWAAGLIVGEGYIGIVDTSTSYQLVIEVTMTSKKAVEKLYDLFGGRFKPLKKDKRFKQTWQWSISGYKATDVLKLIKPYVIGKEEEVEIALKFSKLLRKQGKSLSKRNLSRREQLYQELKESKKIEDPIRNK